MIRLGGPSFWIDDLGGPPHPRPALQGDHHADVAIIGAGYTGLWTAYYLATAAPELKIHIIDKHYAGFGASGRNGGWLTGGFAWSHARYARVRGASATRAMVTAMNETVAEVLSVARALGIGADIRETSELIAALNPAQVQRLQAEMRHRQSWGEDGRLAWLDADALAQRVAIPSALGAMEVSGVARIHPAKLVFGLAQAVTALGVTISERTEATEIRPGEVTTPLGRLIAPNILRCTEGFTAEVQGHRRDWLPLNSAQIATAPLGPEIWAKIGMQYFEIVGDSSHIYSYCQRSEDGRLLVGSRGTPYRFGSRFDQDGRPDPATIALLHGVLRKLFPAAAEAAITHAWCGTLAVPRDWCASLSFDHVSGQGHAGGYVGVGVSTSNLAGRTLCDLVLRRDTDLTRLPWVNRPTRKWEPEPLRWLGLRGMYAALGIADRREARPNAGPSRLADLAYRLTGRG